MVWVKFWLINVVVFETEYPNGTVKVKGLIPSPYMYEATSETVQFADSALSSILNEEDLTRSCEISRIGSRAIRIKSPT